MKGQQVELTKLTNQQMCAVLRYDGAAINSVLGTTLEERLAEAANRIESLGTSKAALEALVEWLEVQATPLEQLMPGWIGIPAVEWEAIMAKWREQQC